MKGNVFSVIVAIATCLFGVIMGAALTEHYRHSKTIPAASQTVPAPTPCAAPETAQLASGYERENDDYTHYKLKNNGTKLPLIYEGLTEENLLDAKVKPLADGRTLVGLHNGLYMLDDKRRLVWKYEVEMLFDFAFVEATSLVYGTAGDNTMFILDAKTGEQALSDGRNGKAGYGQAIAYGKDVCLITDNFFGYREQYAFSKDGLEDNQWWYKQAASDVETNSDGVTAWRGRKVLWHRSIPPDSELIVQGEQILAVTRTRGGIQIKEIVPPQKVN